MDRNEILIITNNSMVQNSTDIEVSWVGNSNENGIYYEALNYISQGHSLLSHPLAGSVKPNQNPFRSIVVSKYPQKFNVKDYKIIENCLVKAESMSTEKFISSSEAYKDDLQMIDQQLLTEAINSLCESR